MTTIESFSLDNLDGILRKVLSLSAKCDLDFSLTKGEDGAVELKVTSTEINRQYVLIKVGASISQNANDLSVIQPAFIVENKQNEKFGAFNIVNDFVLPEQNNLKHLEVILKALAKFQANILTTNDHNINHQQSAYKNFKDVAHNVASIDYFKSVDKAQIEQTLEQAQVNFNTLLESNNLLVRSIWASKNVYVNTNSAMFFDISSGQLLPPAYDALLYIFSLTDESFRQKHFEDLASWYFKFLTDYLQSQNSKVQEKITRAYKELQLQYLLPIIKFVYANDLAETKQQSLEEILANLLNYFESPLLQQEEIYQATKNKLSSNDYTLLSYKFTPLTVKNGHLGDYYHLKILVNFQGNKQTLNLFAKFLKISIELFKDFIENIITIKEDFFYSTLYKLFQDQGLEAILDFAPKCYLSKLSGSLVLDDYSALGYSGLKPNCVLNFEELKVVLKKLAQLHASSVIAEERLSKKGKLFRFGDDYEEYFEDKILVYEDRMQEWFDSSLEALYWTLSKFPDVTKGLNLSTEELNKKLRDILFGVFSKIKRSDTIRNVVNHGDMYIANMLMKTGHEESDAVLIDFQVMRYVPPAYEVLFFIFLSSTKETRSKYLSALLDSYYENFANCLKKFNLNPEEIYSRKTFQENVNYSKSASLANAFLYGHLVHIDADFREEISHDQEKSKYYMQDHKDELLELSFKEEHFRNILKGLAQDFIDMIKSEK